MLKTAFQKGLDLKNSFTGSGLYDVSKFASMFSVIYSAAKIANIFNESL